MASPLPPQLHQQLLQHVLDKAIDHERRSPPPPTCHAGGNEQQSSEIFEVVGLVLEDGEEVLRLDVGQFARGGLIADQQQVRSWSRLVRGIALQYAKPVRDRCLGIGRRRCPWRSSAVRLPADASSGAEIHLLMTVGDGDRIEFAARIVAAQDAARIFPGDGRPGLDLGQEMLERLPRHSPRLVTKL